MLQNEHTTPTPELIGQVASKFGYSKLPGMKIVIIRLHHVQITLPRGMEEQGREFYCGLLGLPEVEKPEVLQGRGGFWLQVGDRQVHVGTEDGVLREVTKAHIAYEVDDIAAWRTRLGEYGIEILEAVPLTGLERFEIRDPFGNRVEFTQVIA